jgi:3-phenylpropionate/trans-cinnamate dioxygenase ferredoxin reductase subunit
MGPVSKQICVVIGASHAGVNFAFALRKEGWLGRVLLFDADPEISLSSPPYVKSFFDV